MIALLGLMDIHPFSGEQRGLFVLAHGPKGEFRFPVTEEQAAILLEQLGEGNESAEEEEDEDIDPATLTPAQSVSLRQMMAAGKQNPTNNDDDEEIVRIKNPFKMGSPSSIDLDDDDL
jgi:hypothetical protein